MAPLSTEKQKYYHLLSLICEDLPTAAVDLLVRTGEHPASSVQLMAVRHGRQIHLQWLIDLVRVGLPDFDIPEELLPAVATLMPAPATLFQA